MEKKEQITENFFKSSSFRNIKYQPEIPFEFQFENPVNDSQVIFFIKRSKYLGIKNIRLIRYFIFDS